MRLWIDATVGADLQVFGMTMLERHLRAAARSGVTSISIDVGIVVAPPPLPRELPGKLTVQFRRGPGSVSQRLAGFLRESDEPVMAVVADSIVDPRLIDFALGHGGSFVARDRSLALLVLDPVRHRALPPADSIADLAETLLRDGQIADIGQHDFPAFVRGLRRTLPFYILPVRTARERDVAERFLFRSNYKGSTDFFTKYVYPALVWRLLRPLARLRIHPNWVTALNVVLGIAAIPLFAAGEFLLGFVCAYTMSVLDSVDGKLARLTFSDSKLGTLLDHGLDLIHPPFWYVAWAWGISGAQIGDPIMSAAAMLVVIYILDRLCLKVYSVNFRRGLHAHAAIDGIVRTFIARRNINLPVFTVGVILGLGVQAFLLILAWQLATLVWHACRVGWILLFEVGARDVGDARPLAG